jgi:hypothetical protein
MSFIRKPSCLAHVINLGTQVLIKTHSKSPHYNLHDPKAHKQDQSATGNQDEVGLVCSICVKVHTALCYVRVGTTK